MSSELKAAPVLNAETTLSGGSKFFSSVKRGTRIKTDSFFP
jgi:hypothetical protein